MSLERLYYDPQLVLHSKPTHDLEFLLVIVWEKACSTEMTVIVCHVVLNNLQESR